ncbi:hypothetical protein L195_g008021 [Trifolium pratense]|uniref:Uncharacterized protein n=1 Tax=Trifolium pratense TaxID=57577 RepID=A0A2K3P7Z6_TRIPR|nr:hypothetical protein L195_g008021 [Trifolium pratense]
MLTEIPTCFAGIESLFAILALDLRKTAIELALSATPQLLISAANLLLAASPVQDSAFLD